MSNTKNKNYYGFKQNKQENPYGRYTPGTVGKIAIAVTVPSAIIAFVSVMIALLTPMILSLIHILNPFNFVAPQIEVPFLFLRFKFVIFQNLNI